MSQIAINKMNDVSMDALPVLDVIAKRIEEIERRAFDLFERRGRKTGHELEDWLEAERELIASPVAKLSEKDGAYKIQVALPGFDEKEVEVFAAPCEIAVHAATKQENGKRDGALRTEFSTGEVYRRFELPNPIEVGRVTANLDNGLLVVNAPELSKPQKAEAKTA
jgi:HSP20 family molecular chaperone IbpA